MARTDHNLEYEGLATHPIVCSNALLAALTDSLKGELASKEATNMSILPYFELFLVLVALHFCAVLVLEQHSGLQGPVHR